MTEKELELMLVRSERRGGELLSLSPGINGVPDRLVLLPGQSRVC